MSVSGVGVDSDCVAAGDGQQQEEEEAWQCTEQTVTDSSGQDGLVSLKHVHLPTSPPYTCTLTPHLRDKALHELQEKPEWRERDIQALRDIIRSQAPTLFSRTDDTFLLRFLRARKFDYDRAFTLLSNYYRLRSENEDIFESLYPSAVLPALNDGIQYVLPERTADGCRIVVLRVGNWQPARGYDIMDIFKVLLLTLEKLIEEEETQVCGMVVIADFTGFSLRHMRYMGPGFVRKVTSLMQESFPARFKGIHYIREPPLLGVLFNIIKPFLKEKILDRLHFHGSQVDSLHLHIDTRILPADLGGALQVEISSEQWRDALLLDDEKFKSDLVYGFNKPPVLTAASVSQMDSAGASDNGSSESSGAAVVDDISIEDRRNSDLEKFAIGAYRKLICTQPSSSE